MQSPSLRVNVFVTRLLQNEAHYSVTNLQHSSVLLSGYIALPNTVDVLDFKINDNEIL